jgi:hypothetical protein
VLWDARSGRIRASSTTTERLPIGAAGQSHSDVVSRMTRCPRWRAIRLVEVCDAMGASASGPARGRSWKAIQ